MPHRSSVQANYFAIVVAKRPLAQQVIDTDIADHGFSIPETGSNMLAPPNWLSHQSQLRIFPVQQGGLVLDNRPAWIIITEVEAISAFICNLTFGIHPEGAPHGGAVFCQKPDGETVEIETFPAQFHRAAAKRIQTICFGKLGGDF